ncbi:MAG: hypothetical protein IPJ65_06255 [Archangiaceae bacterium]|nr:hypothetical protein [Archangiaceae bacterium]
MTTGLLQSLEAYQRFDPPGWIDVYRAFPFWAGLCGAALGLLMLMFGNGRLFRLAAGPLGALVAVLWAPLVAAKLGLTANAGQVTLGAAIALGGLGFMFPPGGLFFIVGVPGGLIAGELVGGSDWMLGFFPGLLVTGALAAAAHRFLGAIASAAFGGWLLILGLLSALSPLGSLSASLAGQPWGCIIAAGLFAIAGAVFQLFVRLSPDQRARVADEKRRGKKRRSEQKAMEDRWANYSKNKGLDT